MGNYTSEWDLVGARFRDEMPISPWDAMRYAWESCEALLRDEISVGWVRRGEADPRKRWDVAVVDGAFPECLLGVLHGEDVPTIMLNTVTILPPLLNFALNGFSHYLCKKYYRKICVKLTRKRRGREREVILLRYQVALYSGSISRQGNPSPWSVTPYFGKSLTQDMSLAQRIVNAACLVTLRIMHWIMITGYLQPVLRKYLGIVVYYCFIRSSISFTSPPFFFSGKKKTRFRQGINCPTCEI